MEKIKSFLNLLQIDPEACSVIAVVGGGGKTSLIYRLTRELVSLGKTVIVTTTTHMAVDENRPFAPNGDRKKVQADLSRYGYTVAASVDETSGKLASLPETEMEALRELCDVLLIEADGSRQLPLKVPESWEPVIPSCADLVISVVGLDCLGKPIREVSHRTERTADFLRKELDAPVAEEDVIRIATSICGLFKNVEERTYRVYLNKADVLDSEEPAKTIRDEIERKQIVAAYGSLL